MDPTNEVSLLAVRLQVFPFVPLNVRSFLSSCFRLHSYIGTLEFKIRI